MNTLYLTHGATKQTMDAWGFTNPRFYPRSRGIGVFTVDLPGADPAADPNSVIPFGDSITISGIFPGMNSGAEVVIFKGTRRQWSGRAHPEARSTTLTFCDAVWDLQNTPFQHYWQYQNPGSSSPTTEYFSRINLFQNISAGPSTPWTYFTVKQQLQEILTYAASNCGIAIAAGTIDPTQVFNLMPCKSVSCWDAIMKCLQLLPDVMTQMDYTQTPPKLNFFQRTGSAGTITLPYSGTDANGRAHKSSDLKDHPDLVPSQVVVQYQQTNTTNGVNANWWYSDVYPALSTGAAVQALVVPIDITGPAITTLSKTVNAEVFDPTTTTFWKKYKHELALPDIVPDPTTPILDTTINGGSGHPTGITVTDEAGNPISLTTYPNILLPGDSVSSWMHSGSTGIIAIKAVVTGHLKYTKTKAVGASTITTDKKDNHAAVVRLTLTNSAAGSTSYETITSVVQGETAPTGLAQYWYDSLRPTPWEGTHTIVEDSIYAIITPANVLNLTGSSLTNQAPGATFNTAWATMAATIVDVEIDFFRGTTRIDFGPHKHVSLNEYYDLIMAWRWRAVFKNLTERNTGVSGGAAALDISGLTTRENTTDSVPETSVHTVATQPAGSPAATTVIQHDAATNGGQLLINSTKDVSGTPTVDTTQPQVKLAQTDLATADGSSNPVAKWQTWNIGGAQVAVAASKAITSAGGGGIACTLVSVWSTYYLVTDGTNYYRAAKPPTIQPGFGATDIGVSYTFGALTGTTTSYPASMLRTSTATSGPNVGNVENEIVWPMPQVGWWLTIAQGPSGGVGGLTVDSGDTAHGGVPGNPITYISTDNWGCTWFAPPDQTVSDW
jgi:hypothetical protein